MSVSNLYFSYGRKVERGIMSEKKKMGRPRVENPRNIRVEIRFSSAELAILDAKAKEKGLTRADLIRLALSKLK